MNKFVKFVAFFFAVLLVPAVLAGCGINPDLAEPVAYVSLKINPEAEFTVDGEGRVLSVTALNADAEIVLSDMELVGLAIDEAAGRFTAAAAESGYMDVEGSEEENEIEVTVVGEDAEEKSISESVAKKIRSYFENNGINGKVSEASLELYAEQAASLGISVGKTKIVLRAIDLYPDAALEELAAMPVKDIVKLINQGHKQNSAYTARSELKESREQLKTEFADMFALAKQIEDLELQLDDFTGIDEDKAVLEAELAAKISEFETQKTEYKKRLETLIGESKAKIDEIKEQRKAEKQSRKEAFREQFEEHLKKVKEND